MKFPILNGNNYTTIYSRHFCTKPCFFKWSLTFIVETLQRRDKYFVIQQKMLNRLLRHWLYAHYQIPKYLVHESLKNSKRWDFSLEKWFFFDNCMYINDSILHTFFVHILKYLSKSPIRKKIDLWFHSETCKITTFLMHGVIRTPRFLMEYIIVTT